MDINWWPVVVSKEVRLVCILLRTFRLHRGHAQERYWTFLTRDTVKGYFKWIPSCILICMLGERLPNVTAYRVSNCNITRSEALDEVSKICLKFCGRRKLNSGRNCRIVPNKVSDYEHSTLLVEITERTDNRLLDDNWLRDIKKSKLTTRASGGQQSQPLSHIRDFYSKMCPPKNKTWRSTSRKSNCGLNALCLTPFLWFDYTSEIRAAFIAYSKNHLILSIKTGYNSRLAVIGLFLSLLTKTYLIRIRINS